MFSTMALSLFTDGLVGNPAPYPYVPNALLNIPPRMTFGERVKNALVSTLMDVVKSYVILPMQETARAKFFPNSPDLYEVIKNTSLVLLSSHVSITNPRPLVPNTIEIGGFHIKDPKPLPADLKKFLDDAKEGVVNFSLGSNVQSKHMPVEMKNAIVASLAKLKQKVLWKWEEDVLPGQPKNVKTMKWAPQNDLLDLNEWRRIITTDSIPKFKMELTPLVKSNPCFCKTLRELFTISRLFGLIPFKNIDKNGKCVFKFSKLWSLYTFILFTLSLWCFIDSILKFQSNMMFITMLIILYKCIAPLFCVYFYSMTLLHRNDLFEALNHTATLQKNNLLCPHSLKTLRRLSLIFIIAFGLTSIFALAVPLIFELTTNTEIPNPNSLLQKACQFLPAGIVGYIDVVCISTMIYLTNCFKSVLINTVKYEPKMSKQTNFRLYALLGLIRYDFICTKYHKGLDDRVPLTSTERFDCLRGMHEIVCISYQKIGAFSASYLAVCIGVTLLQIIFFIYIFVVIWKYDDDVIEANYLFFVENYIIIGMNVINLLLALYLGSLLVNETVRINNILYEYAALNRLDDVECLQIRLFTEKLQNNPYYFSVGTTKISMGLLGTVCGNIITYILVALQFRPPTAVVVDDE